MKLISLWILWLQAAEPRMTVTLEQCGEVSAASVTRILDVELRVDPSVQMEGAHLHARCEPQALALELQRKEGPLSRRRIQVRKSEPKVLERLIALTGAEMLSAPQKDEVPPEPEASALTKPASSSTQVVPPEPESSTTTTWLAELQAEGRSFPSGRLFLWGAHASVLRAWLPRVLVGVDAGYAQGATSTALGNVGATWWGVGLMGRCYQPIGASISIEETVGLGMGEAQLRGQSSLRALWWGPRGELGMAWALGPSFRLRGSVSGGYAFRGIWGSVPGEMPVSAAGTWISFGLGAGWSWR